MAALVRGNPLLYLLDPAKIRTGEIWRNLENSETCVLSPLLDTHRELCASPFHHKQRTKQDGENMNFSAESFVKEEQ